MPTTQDVISAITTHHAELHSQLSDRVAAVLAAVRASRAHQAAVDELLAMLRSDVVPHARAEEEVLYAAATDRTLAPLVTGMVFEHETLLGLVDELAAASTAVDAAAAARAILAVFTGHVRRENELLLPALASDARVDLVALLPVMEQHFAAHQR